MVSFKTYRSLSDVVKGRMYERFFFIQELHYKFRRTTVCNDDKGYLILNDVCTLFSHSCFSLLLSIKQESSQIRGRGATAEVGHILTRPGSLYLLVS